jgi:hypothetical protein
LLMNVNMTLTFFTPTTPARVHGIRRNRDLPTVGVQDPCHSAEKP